jgi:hypothetical protein
MRSKKKPIDLVDEKLLHILNRVFMDGGAAYREKGLFSKWRGWADQDDWANSMVRAADDISRLFKKK